MVSNLSKQENAHFYHSSIQILKLNLQIDDSIIWQGTDWNSQFNYISISQTFCMCEGAVALLSMDDPAKAWKIVKVLKELNYLSFF